MADTKVTALTELTDPLGSDLEYVVDDPDGTPISKKLRKGTNNILPDGYMINGKIDVTVASNNITLALKTKSGGNPSATDPVSVWINGTFRRCTASLSVTKNAGTDWMALGSILPATETDLFAYLIWNTTPATDILDIGFSRYAHGRVYSDFSGTTTNQGYLAFANASTPTSTDDCVVIGRFAATLSATAAFNWSVPAYTTANLIQRPIFETRVLTWPPTYVGFSVNPTSVASRYQVVDNICTVVEREVTPGTSNGTTFTISLPFTAKTVSNMAWQAAAMVQDNGVTKTTACRVRVLSAATVMDVFSDFASGAWTAANGKVLFQMTPLEYEL